MVYEEKELDHNNDIQNELPIQGDELKTKQIMDNNTKMVEMENQTQQTHTWKLSFKNVKVEDYIEQLNQVPILFQDFKKWTDGKLKSEVHRLEEQLKLLNSSL